MKKKYILNKLTKDGYILLKDIISKNECEKIKKIYKTILKKFKKKTKIKNPLEDTVYNLHNKHDIFIKYIDHKKIINIIKNVLSEGSYGTSDFIILRQTALRNPKKGYAQQLHNDTRISGLRYPLIIQAIWMIDDFTKFNGATRLVSNSHKINAFPKYKKKYKKEKIIEGKKGSVLLLNASMWHGSSKKTSDDDRLGMIFSYSRWFLKPSFDHTLNTPLKIYNKLSNYQRELLGFKFSSPKDEFERKSSRSLKNLKPAKNYILP